MVSIALMLAIAGCASDGAVGSGDGPIGGDGPIALDVGSGDRGASADSRAGRVDSRVATDARKTAYACTLVIGFSQTREWFSQGGAFESIVGTDAWQLLWNGGAGVDRWSSASYSGWSNALVSPCRASSKKPDRVVLSISGPYGVDEKRWASAIKATVANIRTKYPAAKRILLHPVVGGPGHKDCKRSNGQRVRASWQHKHVDNAIKTVVGGDVGTGFSPEVRTCADYRDALGHLTNEGAAAAGRATGAFYRSR